MGQVMRKRNYVPMGPDSAATGSVSTPYDCDGRAALRDARPAASDT